jgi:hypothetical protein
MFKNKEILPGLMRKDLKKIKLPKQSSAEIDNIELIINIENAGLKAVGYDYEKDVVKVALGGLANLIEYYPEEYDTFSLLWSPRDMSSVWDVYPLSYVSIRKRKINNELSVNSGYLNDETYLSNELQNRYLLNNRRPIPELNELVNKALEPYKKIISKYKYLEFADKKIK